MELYLNRREIRRRIQARMGHVTNDSQAPQVMEQFNEFIRSAAYEVYRRCPWSATQQETTVSVGIDQRFINYPTNVGPGEIVSIGVWLETEQAYRQLRRGRITVAMDDEPLVEIGEPTSAAGRGTPSVYETKAQIEIWRRPDQAYRLKIDHTVSPNLESDEQVSVVDAEAIIMWAIADAYDFQGDERLATIARQKFDTRISSLIGEQNPATTIKRGRYDRLAVANRRLGSDYVPDSGVWPSTVPT